MNIETILHGVGITLLVCTLGFAGGMIFGFPVAVARRSNIRFLNALSASFVEIIRGIPPIVWLFVLYYGLGNDFIKISNLLAAIVAFVVIATAYISEIYRSGLNAVARGQWEAGQALGFRGIRFYRFVIIPQIFFVVIPPMATYAIGLLKDSAVISIIGVQDITFWAVNKNQTDPRSLLIFGIAAIIYIVLSVPLGVASRRLDQSLSKWVSTRAA